MRTWLAILVTTAFFAPVPVFAAPPPIYVAPQIGSSGLGGKISVGIDRQTDFSVSVGSFVYHQQQTLNSNEADISTTVSFVERLTLQQIALTADRHFGHGPFALTAGFVFNNNHLGASSIPFTENVTIAGTVYSAATAGQAFADVHWHHINPLVGLVYVPRRSGFTASAAIFYEGKPAIDIYETGAIAANRDKIANYISSFETQLQHALGPVTVFPAINVGYRLRI